MLPTDEIDTLTLTLTVTDAIDMVQEGGISERHACLVWGLHRPEEIAEEGVEWGAGLAARWQRARNSDPPRYGVRLD
jgi:hypothetical protein